MSGQIALPLGWPPRPRDDAFLVTPSNARAAHLLEHWGAWPVMTALLVGPRKSGRSLLARLFAAKSGGSVIDDADRAPEEHLFHAWNRAQTARRPLVIVADAPPPAWEIALPDLRSRLAAGIVATIEAPDDQLVRALLAQQFERRNLDARPELVDWLAQRLERSHVAVLRAIDALDQEVLETRKRLTVPLARTTLTAAGLISPPSESA
ncbi:MAG: chromosomal replication initiator DnaA [Sphingomonas bacterium]|uniref:HdaA/DnaA family protein n=1 Tax=Sphingomonas bacterium TaxID=1895847 RepID=UPI00260CF6E8|nr:DnaA/Hda family protein [Sphingomonas bacterium]MDB5695659.1 chromosomal replication initiator DnaA [Sphingomonas bacterium]